MSIEITFRTLKGGTFKLSAEPTETVLDLKKKVGLEQKVDDYKGYRLVHKGKILSDESTIDAAGISSTGFVVVMPPKKIIAKPKPPADTASKQPATESKSDKASTPMDTSSSSSSTAAAAASATTSAALNESAKVAPAAAAAFAAAAATATVAAGTTSASPSATESAADPASSLVTGAAYEASVKQICEMGFPEAQVKKALRAAFNNPERAVDYLFNGIPESAAPAPTPPPAAAPRSTPSQTPSAGTATAPAAPAAGGGAAGTPFNMFEAQPTATGAGAGQGLPTNLDFLRSHPQFNMMRRLIQANPAVLPQLLQLLEETNPNLLALIDANQVEFTRLINEPVGEGEDGGDDDVMEQLAQRMAGAGGPDSGAPGPGQIYVSEEEHEQIVRLSELGATIGLEQSHVVETWLACNRDETLAANFLVDHAEELRADTQRNSPNSTNPPDAPESGDGGPPS